jgi:sugar lactone lactonase YvrE
MRNKMKTLWVMGVLLLVSFSACQKDPAAESIKEPDPSLKVDVVSYAGGGVAGFRDGDLNTAMFNYPKGICRDDDGNIYVADSENKRIRKITPAGIVSTIAGKGSQGYVDGAGAVAMFGYPVDVAVDQNKNVFVADLGNHCIRKISPAGVVSTFAGNGKSGYADGLGTAALFIEPRGICIDKDGAVYVADLMDHRVRKWTTGFGKLPQLVKFPRLQDPALRGLQMEKAGKRCLKIHAPLQQMLRVMFM